MNESESKELPWSQSCHLAQVSSHTSRAIGHGTKRSPKVSVHIDNAASNIAQVMAASARDHARPVKSPQTSRSDSPKPSYLALETAESNFLKDSRYKKYLQLVERNLQLFDNVSEWADFIAFLGRLLKSFQAYPQFPVIPHKTIVGKRLAQCLNPALPSGVHQKALEVYSYIFESIGPVALERDLHIYSVGLFPFLQYASTSSRDTLLRLYDRHILPLHRRLRSITKALIMAMLPGMDDEQNETFTRCESLLRSLSSSVDMSFFFSCLWLVLITQPSLRAPAVKYISRHLPETETKQELLETIGDDPGLMIRGFCATLEDGQILVSRTLLDLLAAKFPLHHELTKETISEKDLVLLLRSALSVVLRRDMSLNRRLYMYLLGQDDTSEAQSSYFQNHSINLVIQAMKDQLPTSNMPLTDRQRVFKILVSLLDKNEIGQPIVHHMVIDILDSLASLRDFGHNTDDVQATATMFFEMTEPYLIWQRLFRELDSKGLQEVSTYELLYFVIDYFRFADEEVQRIHIPLIMASICRLIQRALPDLDAKSDTNLVINKALIFVHKAYTSLKLDYLDTDSDIVFEPHLGDESGHTQKSRVFATDDALAFSKRFYNADQNDEKELLVMQSFSGMSQHALVFILVISVIEISIVWAIGISKGEHGNEAGFVLTNRFLTILLDNSGDLLVQELNIERWVDSMLLCVEMAHSFDVLQSSIEVMTSLIKHNLLKVEYADQRSKVKILVDKIWEELCSKSSVHHVESVRMLWLLNSLERQHHSETIVTNYLISETVDNRLTAYAAFAEIWRLSEDEQNPALSFKRPSFVLLDSLRASEPFARRAGEIWIRTSVKSPLKLIDAVLEVLLSRNVYRRTVNENLGGIDMWRFEYIRRFDEKYVAYMFESLVTIVRFSGQSLLKSAKMTPIRKCSAAAVSKWSEDDGLAQQETSYLEVLIRLVLRYLRSEPSNENRIAMEVANSFVQAHIVDFLQLVVSKGDLDAGLLGEVEEAVNEKLFFAIRRGKIEFQVRLLHLSHAILLAYSSSRHTRKRSNNLRDSDLMDDEVSNTITKTDPQFPKLRTHSLTPLFVRSHIAGISLSTNRPILQHWMDYLIMSLPKLKHGMFRLIIPMIECICQQLSHGVTLLENSLRDSLVTSSPVDILSETELSIFLQGLERTVLFTLNEGGGYEHMDNTQEADLKGLQETLGIQGIANYVSTMFRVEPIKLDDGQPSKANNAVFICLHDVIRVLMQIWRFSTESRDAFVGSHRATFESLSPRLRQRVKKLIEKLYKQQPVEVLEDLIETFVNNNLHIKHSSLLSLLREINGLTEQITISFVLDSIRSRTPGMQPEKFKRSSFMTNLSDLDLLDFLNMYYEALDGEIAVQVWSESISFFKEFLVNPNAHKHTFAFILKGLVSLANRVSETCFMEDRKVRKDMQDLLMRMCDAAVLVASRSYEATTWRRRTTRDDEADFSLAGGTSPNPERPPIDSGNNDMEQTADHAHRPEVKSRDGISEQIYSVLARDVLPKLSRLLLDQDKTSTLCSNIVYYVVSPAFRGRPGVDDVPHAILNILQAMVQINGCLKSWKAAVSDAFGENRFFNMNLDSAKRWRSIIRALISNDREKIVEQIAKISAASSTTLFGNRDVEAQNRVCTLRRLAFMLFSGEVDQCLLQLPLIEEKLVEMTRLNANDASQREIYLCLSVMLIRFSPVHLSNFWPVILTELFRVFDQFLRETTEGKSTEAANVLLAACKFIDLLIVLEAEDFQVHQWIFISDTLDAVNHLSGWKPDGMLDQLAYVVDGALDDKHDIMAMKSLQLPSTPEKKRPILTMRRIESIRDLHFFLKHVSLFAYETAYSLMPLDDAYIEEWLLSDMFGETKDEENM